MDTETIFLAFMAGFLMGAFAFTGVANLLRVARESLKGAGTSPSNGSRIAFVALASLASSGLWTLVVVVGVFYAMRQKPWAPFLYMGTAAWLLFLGLMGWYAVRRHRRRTRTNDAV